MTAAGALGDSLSSAGFMLAFGAGTLPALAAAGTIASWTSRFSGARWRLVAAAALAVLGVLLTARGLIPSHTHEQPGPVHQHASHHPAR